jgi:hypothetical protein
MKVNHFLEEKGTMWMNSFVILRLTKQKPTTSAVSFLCWQLSADTAVEDFYYSFSLEGCRDFLEK